MRGSPARSASALLRPPVCSACVAEVAAPLFSLSILSFSQFGYSQHFTQMVLAARVCRQPAQNDVERIRARSGRGARLVRRSQCFCDWACQHPGSVIRGLRLRASRCVCGNGALPTLYPASTQPGASQPQVTPTTSTWARTRISWMGQGAVGRRVAPCCFLYRWSPVRLTHSTRCPYRSIQVKLDKNGAPGGTVIGNYATIGAPGPSCACHVALSGIFLISSRRMLIPKHRAELLAQHVSDRQPGLRRGGLHHPGQPLLLLMLGVSGSRGAGIRRS